jgi:hypothetical protein
MSNLRDREILEIISKNFGRKYRILRALSFFLRDLSMLLRMLF